MIVSVSGVATSKARVSQVQALLTVGLPLAYHADLVLAGCSFFQRLVQYGDQSAVLRAGGSVAQADGLLAGGGGQPIRGQELRRLLASKACRMSP